jgi:hypothetical protein
MFIIVLNLRKIKEFDNIFSQLLKNDKIGKNGGEV